MAVVLMAKFKALSLSKLKVLFLSIFLGFFLVGCGGAQTPEITIQPKSKVATAGTESTLQVTASVSDGGVLFYQWYSNTKNSTEGGTAIEGANTDVLTFTAPSEGFAYYYVVITNIDANASSYASVTSDVAVITVVDYPVYEVSFYDKDLKLLNVETVRGGETINPSEVQWGSWYPLNSNVAVSGELNINSDTLLFAVANVKGISSRAELEAINSDLDGRYVLESNVDLGGSAWTPIGTENKPFTGRLSGKARKITGLTVNTSDNYAGLFGYVKGGHIIAVRVDVHSNGIEGGDYVGGIAGYVNLGTITAVTVSGGDIKGKSYVGAIAGAVRVGTITATTSSNNIEATGNRVGGVTGDISIGTITATYTRGDIKSSSGEYVGGIAGYSDLSTITATFGIGEVTGKKYVGGAVGYLRYGSVVASYLHGKVNGDDKVGKVVGDKKLGIVLFGFTDGLSWFS
ncbi:MAG: hypothetical protein LBG21_05970 [Campylobacteraceae bacterium]|jgi:hypothetical protein|nr:hypothetical protein [Campylobacteraceae bacterium]